MYLITTSVTAALCMYCISTSRLCYIVLGDELKYQTKPLTIIIIKKKKRWRVLQHGSAVAGGILICNRTTLAPHLAPHLRHADMQTRTLII